MKYDLHSDISKACLQITLSVCIHVPLTLKVGYLSLEGSQILVHIILQSVQYIVPQFYIMDVYKTQYKGHAVDDFGLKIK